MGAATLGERHSTPPHPLRYAATDKADLGTETDTNTNQVRCGEGGR